MRLRTHAKEPLVWQQAVVRALREQGVVAVALTLAEQMAQQLAAWVKQMEQQIAPWEATRPEWQAALGRLRKAPGIGRWGALVLRVEEGDLQWLRNGKASVRHCG